MNGESWKASTAVREQACDRAFGWPDLEQSPQPRVLQGGSITYRSSTNEATCLLRAESLQNCHVGGHTEREVEWI